MKTLVIGKVWPEPKSSAAGRRMVQLIELLKESGEVLFATPAVRTGFEYDVRELGVECLEMAVNDTATAEQLHLLQPDCVVFDRFMMEEQFGWLVAENCPDAIRILNTEDLHFLRKARETALKTGNSIDLYTDDMARELAAIYRSDLTLLISEYEYYLVRDELEVPEQLLHYLPLFSDSTSQWVAIEPGFSGRKDCIFAGNFLHAPNLDAVRWLKKEIWPLVRKESHDAKVHIYGAYPTTEVMQMHRPDEGFMVHGRVEDLQAAFRQSKVNLAPLRFGAGIKGKLLEAMECGTPSVATPVAVEGMLLGTEWAGTIAHEPKEFAGAVLHLLHHETDWTHAAAIGKQILETRFKRSDFVSSWKQRLEALANGLHVQRKSDYVAFMVRHQSLQATRYLSKWIMEKNATNSGNTT